MRNYFFALILAFLNITAIAQKMNIGESQADFRFLVSGLKLIDGKYVSVGLQTNSRAMDSLITSLKKEFTIQERKKPSSDSIKLVILERLAYCYSSYQVEEKGKFNDSIIYYQNQILVLARKIKESDMVARAYLSIWQIYKSEQFSVADQVKLLKAWIKDYNSWIKDIGIRSSGQSPHLLLSSTYEGINDEESAEKTALKMLEASKVEKDIWYANSWLGNFYYRFKNMEKALFFFNRVLTNHPSIDNLENGNIIANAAYNLAKIKIENKEFEKALSLTSYFSLAKNCNDCRGSKSNLQLESEEFRRNVIFIEVYLGQNNPSKALPHLQKLPVLLNSNKVNEKVHVPIFDKLWHEYYLQVKDNAKALEFLQKYMASKDSVEKVANKANIEKSKSGISLIRNYEKQLLEERSEKEKLLLNQQLFTIAKQKELEKIKAESDKRELLSLAEKADLQRNIEKSRIEEETLKNKQAQEYRISSLNKDIAFQQRTRTFLISLLALFFLFFLILIKQNLQKRKANALLQKQRDEINKQRSQLQQSLESLKSTQAQLIQSEKMASLGELTSGIAHEIQNPLNFVNNFSELSVDLAKDLEEEVKKPELFKDIIIDLIKDLKSNQEKINHHGKRASSIVNGMLEHSRKSSGTKETIDINMLTDEYLRLAYYGLRAKNKDFNAELITNFDPNLPKVKVVPQDIGRVILNLITNAFYVLNERNKKEEIGYVPKVVVRTMLTEFSQLIIAIKDNGMGIPATIKDKIFQPFFTTKPTGQGTGLGLSLAYEIVKAHNGELTVDSTEGEGTEFYIKMPIS